METILPKALTLAAELRAGKWTPNILQNESALRDRAADELRRQHAEIESLRTELVSEAKYTANEKLRADQMAQQHRMQSSMNTSAREELAVLRSGYDAARLEIASLHAQLEAVGAGGVGPQLVLRQPECWCESCDTAANRGRRSRMSLCPQCGDKRCTRAKNHTEPCNSVEPLTDARIAAICEDLGFITSWTEWDGREFQQMFMAFACAIEAATQQGGSNAL